MFINIFILQQPTHSYSIRRRDKKKTRHDTYNNRRKCHREVEWKIFVNIISLMRLWKEAIEEMIFPSHLILLSLSYFYVSCTFEIEFQKKYIYIVWKLIRVLLWNEWWKRIFNVIAIGNIFYKTFHSISSKTYN